MADVRIYTTDFCGYCIAAKALLTKKGVAFEEIDCSRDATIRTWLVQETGMRTVPQIFIRGVPVGGFDDLAELDRSGDLDPILAGTQTPEHI